MLSFAICEKISFALWKTEKLYIVIVRYARARVRPRRPVCGTQTNGQIRTAAAWSKLSMHVQVLWCTQQLSDNLLFVQKEHNNEDNGSASSGTEAHTHTSCLVNLKFKFGFRFALFVSVAVQCSCCWKKQKTSDPWAHVCAWRHLFQLIAIVRARAHTGLANQGRTQVRTTLSLYMQMPLGRNAPRIFVVLR